MDFFKRRQDRPMDNSDGFSYFQPDSVSRPGMISVYNGIKVTGQKNRLFRVQGLKIEGHYF
jgi:hypothetical protein